MKIAMVLRQFPALTITFILNQITGLIDRGHEIDIYSKTKPKIHMIQNEVYRYDLLKRTTYLVENKNKVLWALKTSLFLFKKFIQKPGTTLKLLKFTISERKSSTSKNKLFPLENIKLCFYLMEKEYDVIHFHFGTPGKYIPLLKKMKIDAKMVISFYGIDLTQAIKKHGIHYYDDVFNYGDLFLPICNYFKNILIDLGCKKNKIKVHPLGIDTATFKCDNYKLKYRNQKERNVYSIGRFVEKKGLLYSIEAFSKVNFENLNYFIIGDGPMKPELEYLIESKDLKDKIHLIGSFDRKEIIEHLKKCHIFILTSITANNGDMEGTPTVLLEAQSMSIPVISTYHSGIPEIVVHEKSGFLVKERDTNAISKYLKDLLDDPKKCIEMGDFGRSFIINNYDIKKLNLKLENYFKSLLA